MNRSNKGFTLIELMVALTISLLVLVAMLEVYSSTRQTNRVQSMQSRLSEDGRFALSMLQRTISQAGFRPSSATVLDATRIVPTSGSAVTLKFTPDGTNIMSCNGTTDAAGVAVTEVISYASNKLTCTPTVGGVAGTAVDWIAPTAAGVGNGTEIIDFALQYGVDTASTTTVADYLCGATRDCVADSFAATLPGGAVAAQIVAVKVCLVLRTEQKDAGIIKAANVNDCGGTAITNSQADNRLYRTFRSTVLLKNR